MKILVCPDIHGRLFWRTALNDIDNIDKVVFLGDYIDPYDFEGISVDFAINNLKQIIEFARFYSDKVVLLLGNHDLPYFSDTYYQFSNWHSRHSDWHHNEIHDLFNENRDLFNIAYTVDNILFTHAGCTNEWLHHVFTSEYKITSLDDLTFSLNNLLNTEQGLRYLFMIGPVRYGPDQFSSCVWCDKNELIESQELYSPNAEINNVRQIFGHTLLGFYGSNDYKDNFVFSPLDPIEHNNIKMCDVRKPFLIDSETFKVIYGMKYIFLDIDGVLNSEHSLGRLDKVYFDKLERIIDETGAKIVISSSWRTDDVKSTIDEIIETSRYYGCAFPSKILDNIVGVTPKIYVYVPKSPHLEHVQRGIEIKDFLDNHYWDSYVILDDDTDMIGEQFKYFVHVSSDIGLSNDNVEQAIKLLNKDPKTIYS